VEGGVCGTAVAGVVMCVCVSVCVCVCVFVCVFACVCAGHGVAPTSRLPKVFFKYRTLLIYRAFIYRGISYMHKAYTLGFKAYALNPRP